MSMALASGDVKFEQQTTHMRITPQPRGRYIPALASSLADIALPRDKDV
jgi:hypothetical protein